MRCTLSACQTRIPPPSVRLQVHCTLPTSRTRISPFHRYQSGYRCFACPPPLSDAHSPFHRHLSAYRCAVRSLPLSDAHHPFPALSIQQLMRFTLSTSPSHASPFSSAIIRLHVRCPLFISPMHISFFSTARNPAIDAWPTIYLSLTCIIFYNCLQFFRRCIAPSPTLSNMCLFFHYWLVGHCCVARCLPLPGTCLCFPLLATLLLMNSLPCLSAARFPPFHRQLPRCQFVH